MRSRYKRLPRPRVSATSQNPPDSYASFSHRALPLTGKLGDCKCDVHILTRSRPLLRARWAARSACACDHLGCIYDFAAVADMSVAATTRPIVMPGGTLKPPVIRLLKATILPRDGAGATSTTSKSIWQARHRTTVQSRALSETASSAKRTLQPRSGSKAALATAPGSE